MFSAIITCYGALENVIMHFQCVLPIQLVFLPSPHKMQCQQTFWKIYTEKIKVNLIMLSDTLLNFASHKCFKRFYWLFLAFWNLLE